MPADTYQCAMCHGVFEKARDDSEAFAETKEQFGDVPPEDCE